MENVQVEKLNPPLKWAGGKRWLVPHVLPLWESHGLNRYVEPMCGGLAVALGLSPDQAILNDINPHVINFYNWVSKGLKNSIDMRNDSDLFYENRAEFNKLTTNGKVSSKKSAELFYYLNRTCFNGLCRFNSKGEFNVPVGRYKTINYADDFLKYKNVFENWTFTSTDFENVELQEGDFVYADPPYDVEFTKYSKEDFRWEDQERLAVWLSKHKGTVLLSNQATDRIVKLYESLGYKLKYLDAPRRISCTGDRTPAKEVLATLGI